MSKYKDGLRARGYVQFLTHMTNMSNAFSWLANHLDVLDLDVEDSFWGAFDLVEQLLDAEAKEL